MTYQKTMLEKFNETGGRGDILSFSREDVARLYALPVKMCAPIIHALFGWFLNGENEELKDPRDRAMLEGFKEHQLANAWKRKGFLEKQNNNANMRKSSKPREAMATHGKPRIQVEVKEEDKDEVISPLSSSLVEGDKSRADAALVPSLSVEDAKRELAIIAPQISSHPCLKASNGRPTAECRKWISGSLDSVVRETGYRIFDRPFPDEDSFDDKDEFEAELDKYNDELERKVVKPVLAAVGVGGKEDESDLPNEDVDAFKRAYVHAMIEANDDGTVVEGRPIRSKTAFVIARMKRARKAVMALKQKPTKAGDLSDVSYD